MDFIEDKEKAIEIVNDVINNLGDGKEIAETLDNVIFEYINLLCKTKSTLIDEANNTFYTLKYLRDSFNDLNKTLKNN